MTHVLISYSRKNATFAHEVYRYLIAQGVAAWIDTEQLQPSVEWWSEITRQIDRATSFICILTPDYLKSPVCHAELARALEAGKKIIPILHEAIAPNTDWQTVTPLNGTLATIIGKHDLAEQVRHNDLVIHARNWIIYQSADHAQAAQQAILSAIQTDLDYQQHHANILQQARKWQATQHERSLLLRGTELRAAQQWLDQPRRLEPLITDLQRQFIERSQADARRRQITNLAVAIVVALLLAVVGLVIVLPNAQAALVQPPELAWIEIPAGTFLLGKAQGGKHETPQHEINLPGFQISHDETTNLQYQRCEQAKRCEPPDSANYSLGAYATHPVVGVNWYEARAFCAWIGGRLPTEAEWEKAATWDNKAALKLVLLEAANTFEFSPGTTQPVGSYPLAASPFGANDMIGNVWEWTASLFVDYPYQADDGRENSEANGNRSVRGGSFLDTIRVANGTNRVGLDPSVRENSLGFRCVKDQ